MSRPYLSVVVPAFNEETCIASCIERLRAELERLAVSWEIVVADDGSTDRTLEIAESFAGKDDRVRVIASAHYGKGAAVRTGLTGARGQWRFMADADLSMPPSNLGRFLAVANMTPAPELVIGSREAEGARRIGEPWTRHAIGRVFNWFVRLCAVRGLSDTQCGFKLLSATAVEAIVPQLTTNGFAFDVEMLFLAQRGDLDVREVGIEWHCRKDSRVAFGRGAAAFADVLRIRWRAARRGYAIWAYLLAMLFACWIAYDVMRMPIQV